MDWFSVEFLAPDRHPLTAAGSSDVESFLSLPEGTNA
jgi:hypothetical protein